MSLTKICEHDRNLDNDERECVELDQKNKKNLPQRSTLMYEYDRKKTTAQKSVITTNLMYASFGHIQPGRFPVVVFVIYIKKFWSYSTIHVCCCGINFF